MENNNAKLDQSGLASASPPRPDYLAGSTGEPIEPTPPPLEYSCPECLTAGEARSFGSKAGLSLHRRRTHTTTYMGERLEANNPKKAVWSDEEIHLLALKEHQWVNAGRPGKHVNQSLQKVHPARTVDSITGCRKTDRYIFALRAVRAGVIPLQPAGGTSQPQENALNTWSEALKVVFVSRECRAKSTF